MQELQRMFLLPVTLLSLLWGISGQLIDNIEYRILEGLEADTQIANIATDSKLSDMYLPPDFAKLRFRILANPEDSTAEEYFAIGQSTAMLTLTRSVDRDLVCRYKPKCEFVLDVAVSPAEFFHVITVKVEILDDNDNRPMFPSPEFFLSIPESSMPGTLFPVPTASDPDGPQYGIKRYEISPAFGSFELRSEPGASELQLELMDRLDREQVQYYKLRINAVDGGNPPLTATLVVNITIVDVNDNPPVFESSNYYIRILEGSSVPQTLLRVKAADADQGANGLVSYGMTEATFGEFGHLFDIRQNTGDIVLINELDREKQANYRIMVTARDGGSGSQITSATVSVTVEDVNDNSPLITVNTLTSGDECEVSESADTGTFVGLVFVSDRDSGANGDVKCRLNVNSFTLEKMSEKKYKIVTKQRLDRESREFYSLVLECYDNGTPIRTSRAIVKVKVIDSNDHTPVFSSPLYQVEITENNNVDMFVVQINATDADSGDNARISFAILNDDEGLFRLDPDTGVIRANSRLDHEDSREIRLRVHAMDHGMPSRSSEAVVSIVVSDVNDEVPKFDQNTYTFVVVENQPINSVVDKVHAVDADSPPYNTVEYSFYATNRETMKSFDVHPESGQITVRRSFDRETQPVYYFTALAINKGYPSMSSTASVTVYVADVNDNSPVIDFPNSVNNSVRISNLLPPGERVTQILAHDLDTGDNALLSYSIQLVEKDDAEQVFVNEKPRAPFGINTQSGDVFVNVELSYMEYEVIDLIVTVTDHGTSQKSAMANLSIIVNKSLAYVGSGIQRPGKEEEEAEGLNRRNMLIIIAVVATTGVLVIILSAAITLVLVKSRRSKKSNDSLAESNSSNGDEFSMKDSYQAAPRPDSQIVGGYTYSTPTRNSTHIDDKANKENQLSTNAKAFKYDLSFVNIPSYTSDTGSSNNHGGVTYISGSSQHTTLPEVKRLQPEERPVEQAAADNDAASSSSGDVSTTDSGRGPSELGSAEGPQDRERGYVDDNRKPVKAVHNPNTRSNSHGTPFSSKTSHPSHTDRKQEDQKSAPNTNGYQNDSSGPPNRQTVRNVKARDKYKKDFGGYPNYPPQTLLPVEKASESQCFNFRDANSVLSYKMKNPNTPGSRCSSEFTDATSTTSATSGSYVIGNDDLEFELARGHLGDIEV